MSLARDLSTNKRFVLLLMTVLLGSQMALYLRVDSLFFVLALIAVGLQIARRPTETLWLGFLLLEVTSQIYPVQFDELGTSVQGAYRPYILSVMVIACSMLLGQWFRPSRTYGRHTSQIASVARRIGTFIAVLFLAVAYGYFSSLKAPGLTDILRECSGWIVFLGFVFLGYRFSSSVAETQSAFAKLRLAVLTSSVFVIVKFIYLSLSSSADETAGGFGYSQRDAVFFSGLVLILLIAQALTSKVMPAWRVTVPAGLVLLLTVLLSGSRSLVATILIVSFLCVIVWRSKTRLVLSVLGTVVVLAGLFGPSLLLSSPQGGFLGYVSNRFLVVSEDDSSLLSHASEMLAVADAVRENPLLGRGPFASYTFFDPLFGWKETTFVDSGLGYLLMKTGLLGTGIFIWFAAGWLRMAQSLRNNFPALTVVFLCSFVFYLVYMLFGPSFFEFQHAWFIGIVVGNAIALASTFPMVRAAEISGALDQSGVLA